jgi:hypothetical protein
LIGRVLVFSERGGLVVLVDDAVPSSSIVLTSIRVKTIVCMDLHVCLGSGSSSRRAIHGLNHMMTLRITW